MKKPQRDRSILMISLGLGALTFAVLGRALGNGFIAYFDDGSYVMRNPSIRDGLSASSIFWAFTTFRNANWHPLTWLSYMVDYQAFGPEPRGFHLTNLLLHIANVVLLFMILNRITKARWPSAFAAALFAIHPLHVESVAWIAERKDVLSTLLWMLTTGAYVLNAERPSLGRYVSVVVFFALGLMSKPMLVTLPLTLLLLDYWPLGRLKTANDIPRRVAEKTPLFALSAASCVVTFIAQRAGGAVGTFHEYPLGVRLANAAVASVSYVGKMLWPVKLAVLYPHPGAALPVWCVAASVLVLVAVSALVIRSARKMPYLTVGWLWYLITLLPVIGIVQVGEQAMADRYTYVPLIGISVAVAWPVLRAVRRPFPHSPILLTLITVLCVLTWIQTGYWRDDETLFVHALKVTRNNATIHGNLGALYAEESDYEHAAEQYSLAVEIRPDAADFRASLGTSLAMIGRLRDAEEQFSEALRLDPELPNVRSDLGSIRRRLRATHGTDEAALGKAVALFNEGVALDTQGHPNDAAAKYREAIRIAPKYADPYCNLARFYYNQGDTDEAIRLCEKAIGLDPDLGQAHNSLAVFLYVKGRLAESEREAREAERCGTPLDARFVRLLSAQ